MEPILVKHLNELPQAAELVLQLLSPAGTVAFYGEMGAGKTTLIREICSRLVVEDQVNSPTFSIVNPYRT
ncbi:MAG: tRNA (adenosine(37)-N6)-threonylcarbamoyltransferase complex ATPase subunit type 1 TsaE, partial [Rikenellaceae bacterium]|nr:tRNA (adenosine(37)-N6)-threonylcarbamoyltransferase complex ATPase subunit type 1 TsaE [Rikenellaceae bacterium]